MITLYSKYRRQNFRNAWTLANMNAFVLRCFVVAVVVLCVLAILGLIHDWSEEKEQHQNTIKKMNNVEQVILSCLNHGGMGINGELHLCRPANTWVPL